MDFKPYVDYTASLDRPWVPGDIVAWSIRSWEGLLAMNYAMGGIQLLLLPVTLCTLRYCFLIYSVLGEVFMPGGTPLHLYVPSDIVC